MIISYSKNFIFIKTKKTAGTTVEAVLVPGCGPDDVVTLKTAGIEPRNTKKKFRNHSTAEEVYPFIRARFWKKALKLTVERHPYEKAVSQAFYKFPKKDRPEDFPAYLDYVVRNADYPGFSRWSLNGEVAVDEFIRQESLKADLDRIGATLGIPIPDELPRLKSKIRQRSDTRPAREILTDEQKEIIYKRCEDEFRILGYER